MDLLDEQLAANLRGDNTEGWRIAKILEQTHPHCHRAAFNRGWHLLQQGEFRQGFECLDRGRHENVFGSGHIGSDKPIWRNQDLRGKRLLLAGEGGLGDEICNARFAKGFAERGANVILTASPELIGILGTINGVDECVPRAELPEHDYWVPAMSAAGVLGYDYATLQGRPYIQLPKGHNQSARCIGRTGVRYFGNPEFEHEQHRTFPSELMDDALRGVDTVSLHPKDGQTWEYTARIISGLDRVITSCTSVAHLSAAMGVETWVVVPILPYYVWALPGNTSPWYNAVKLYRQEKYGDWSAPFKKIQEDLNNVCRN